MATFLILPFFLAQAQNTVREKSLADFDFAVNEVETNYAGFSSTVTELNRQEYTRLKDSLRIQVADRQREAHDAIGELYAWFNDFHLRCASFSAPYMKRKSNGSHQQVKEYNPQSIATRINERTFLIRFPSCGGDNPTKEWVEASVSQYLASGCKNLIIDIRGNGGGSDVLYGPYKQLLYDRPGITDGVEIINTDSVRNFLKSIPQQDWIKKLIEKMENSTSPFIELTPRETKFSYDSISPLPEKAAILIDGNVASSGEQMLLDIRACSSRTTIYGQDNTLGCLDFSNTRPVNLPHCRNTLYVPMTRSCRLPDRGIDQTGIAPDVRITLPPPGTLTDNIDEWTLWVAHDLETNAQ